MNTWAQTLTTEELSHRPLWSARWSVSHHWRAQAPPSGSRTLRRPPSSRSGWSTKHSRPPAGPAACTCRFLPSRSHRWLQRSGDRSHFWAKLPCSSRPTKIRVWWCHTCTTAWRPDPRCPSRTTGWTHRLWNRRKIVTNLVAVSAINNHVALTQSDGILVLESFRQN